MGLSFRYVVVAAGFALSGVKSESAFLCALARYVVVAAGFEPAITWMRTRRPRPLDDATVPLLYHKIN